MKGVSRRIVLALALFAVGMVAVWSTVASRQSVASPAEAPVVASAEEQKPAVVGAAPDSPDPSPLAAPTPSTPQTQAPQPTESQPSEPSEEAQAVATPTPRRQFRNSIGMVLVRMEPGVFRIGTRESAEETAEAFAGESAESFRSEHPQRRVRLTQPFYLGAHEVTVGQFRRFVEATGYKTDAERNTSGARSMNPNAGKFHSEAKSPPKENPDTWATVNRKHPEVPEARRDELPVTLVSWNDARAFCEWLSRTEQRTYRLPTEAEWEYACRAGTTTSYWCGDDPDTLLGAANVPDQKFELARNSKEPLSYAVIQGNDGYAATAPVGQFKANPWGLHDMHGNVWEWCGDYFDAEQYLFMVEPENPTGPTSGSRRVIRGGCFL